MFKFILSIYVLSILMIAGFAKADTGIQMQRIQFSKQIVLPVDNINYDEVNDTLTVEGTNEGFCSDSIKAQTRVISEQNRAIITVSGSNKNCHERTKTFSKSLVLAEAFAAHTNLKGQIILVKVLNSDKSFEYQMP